MKAIKSFFKNHKGARIAGRIVLIAALAAAALALFIALYPPFSAHISRPDRNIYTARSINYEGNRFFNQEITALHTQGTDPYAGRSTGKGTAPVEPLPAVAPALLDDPGEDDLTVTWLGHSTVLLQMSGLNILFDPVLSERVSPVSFAGPRRFAPPALTAEELPAIDLVIITHDHYDHLDMDTIQAIDGKVERYIVPFGIENDLRRWGVAGDKITALGWWEETETGSLTVTCAPARHYSGRNITDKNRTLWASWVLTNGAHKVFVSGDTGMGSHFEEIHNRFGDFDLALLDCGQYSTDWAQVHMFPEEAVDAALTLGAKAAIPIHWGAFVLSGHSWDDPVQRFALRAEETGLTALTPRPGETVNWQNAPFSFSRWWQEIG